MLYIPAARSSNRRHVLAKVGDRPLAECQPLFFQPAMDHPDDELLACTHICIPQALHTNAILANKIWWMWGVEMGTNDHHVAVTITAQHSVFPCEPDCGLLGNDLVRLALERGSSAYEAMHVIISLLEQYGQEGQTHYTADGGRYESAFFIADDHEAWKLETAGRKWVAKRVESVDCIGNCYSIRTEYDELAPGLIEYAVRNSLYDPSESFSFADAFTNPSHLFLRASLRNKRMRRLLNDAPERIDRAQIWRILADHYEGTWLESTSGPFTAVFPSICMHSNDPASNGKSACSMIFEYRDTLGIVCWTAFSNACTSIFLPVYFTDRLPALMTNVSQKYTPDSLWWTMERLTIEAEMDYERAIVRVRTVLDPLQKEIEEEALIVEEKAGLLLKNGEKEQVYALLNGFMEQNAQRVQEAASCLIEELSAERKQRGGPFGPRNRRMLPFWEKAGLPV